MAFNSLLSELEMIPVTRSCLLDASFCSVNSEMLGFLRNPDRPWYATSAFRLAMLRCCVRSLPAILCVLGSFVEIPPVWET